MVLCPMPYQKPEVSGLPTENERCFSIEGMSGESCKEVRFGIRSHSERPDESQAEADSEPDEAAGHLFFRRGAHRRTAFLFARKTRMSEAAWRRFL